MYTVSFTPDGKGVATGGEDNRIRVWNPDNDGKPIRDMGGFGGTVFRLRYRPTARALVACCGDKTVIVFKRHRVVSSASCRATTTGSTPLAISRDGKTIASGSWDGEVRLWNLADGKLIRNFIAAPGYKPAGAKTAGAADPRAIRMVGRGRRSHAKSFVDRLASVDECERIAAIAARRDQSLADRCPDCDRSTPARPAV